MAAVAVDLPVGLSSDHSDCRSGGIAEVLAAAVGMCDGWMGVCLDGVLASYPNDGLRPSEPMAGGMADGDAGLNPDADDADDAMVARDDAPAMALG